MPKNDREVFDHLLSDKGTALQIDFLTYAVFAHEKREWIKLFESQSGGQAPTQGDVDNWISNLTDSQFVSMRSGAENVFEQAAYAYFEERLAAEREDILRSVIVAEVRAASVWWKQLAVALLTAIVAPVLLGSIAALCFCSTYLTPADFANRIRQQFSI